MQKSQKQARRLLAAWLTMMLLVTGLLPIGIVSAAGTWSVLNPSKLVVNDGTTTAKQPTEVPLFGSSANPVETNVGVIGRVGTDAGILLSNTSSSYNGSGIDVVVNGSSISTANKFASGAVELPNIPLNTDGTVTKVTVNPSGFPSDKVELYYKFVPSSTGALVYSTIPGRIGSEGNTPSAPVQVNSRTVSGLKVQYNKPSDLAPSIQVRVNGSLVQTISGTNAKTDNTAMTLSNIDLAAGLNSIQVYAPNTGETAVIYYQYATNDSPITISGFSGQGTTPYTPVLYGESKITISGTFGGGVVGSNLRLKLITNNGQTVQDLSNTAPTVNGTNFTFTDISLKPGLNQIAFYERVGNVTKEHIQFYVQYNNTPLLSDLAIDDTKLVDSSSEVTYVTVPSANRLTLNLSGMAKNADLVKIENTTINQSISAEVSRTGAFSANVPTQLGENTLTFRAFNSNKEVGTIIRKVLVATNSSDSANQFYQAKITTSGTTTGVSLVPNKTVTYAAQATSDMNTAAAVVSGKTLIRFVDITDTQVFDQFRMTFTEVGNTSNTWSIYSKGASPGITYTGPTKPQANFTEYDVKGTIDASKLKHGSTYKVALSYQYLTKASNNTVTSPSGYIDINNYVYEFKYEDSTKPRFVSVVNNVTKLPLSTGTNTVVTSPLELLFTVENFMLNTDNITASFNGAALAKGSDYVLSNIDAKNKTFTLQLNKLPAGVGTLTVTYDSDPTDSANPTVSVSYTLNIQITPYVQLTYVDTTGQVKTFEDGYLIQNDNDIHNLDGKVYNYVLTSSNLEASLNGNTITLETSDFDTAKGTFTINKSKLPYKKGNNVLKIKLKEEPQVTFTYNVSYNTSKTPSVTDIKLEVKQNNKDVEVTKKASDTAYKTESFYLSEFSFNVKDATRVYIEKNGQRISDHRYDSGDWEIETSHQDYQTAYQKAVIDEDLETFFEDNNFEGKSKTLFESKMTSSQYGNLVEKIQDNVTDAEDQEDLLELFPMTLRKGGRTTYTIVAEDDNGTIVRYDVLIDQSSNSWTVLSPVKEKESDPYIVVNTNSVPVKIFAENATAVLFGKTEATVTNTDSTKRDFYYDSKLGKTIPQTYYVFTANVPLKKGLNTIKYTVKVGEATYNDEIKIYNANSSVNGAEYRDTLGKKVSFSVFDKALELKFPAGTVLLSPSDEQATDEILKPSEDIFIDTPLYFGIADRTTGAVTIEDDDLESRLTLETNFNYASPLYYIDAGDIYAPFGRDPYEEDGDDVETFENRWEDNLVPSKAGTLSIKYDPSIVNAANNILTVYYHDGDEWHNLGGVVNTSKKVVTVPFEGFGYYMVMKTRESYDDVVRHDYAREDMETLYAKGIMPAYSGNTFGANRDMTRGEFATMLVKALDLPINAGPYRDSNQRDPLEPTFSDVRPSRDTWDYQYKYIETAARAGIVRGSEPGYFRPDNSLTREEAAVMIARALNLKTTGSVDAAKANLLKMFTDGKDVNYYATTSVLAVTKAKLMNGEPNDASAKKPTYRFLPGNNLTRAEMAVITVRVMVQLKKLPKQ